MESVGERLRRVRLERGLDIHVIADELRISARYLEAIERGDTSVLPGGFFSKSFYRQYGNFLGVYDRQFEVAVENLFSDDDAAPLGRNSPLETATGIPPIPTGSGGSRLRKPLISLAVLVVVVAACSGMYALWQRMQASASAERAAQDSAPPATVTQAPAPTVQPATTPVAETKSEIRADVVLNLAATEKVWLSVTSGGKVLFSGVLEPSQSKALEAGDNARILIGNAGGVDVYWKGRSLGPIGPRGQVRVVVLKPEGFEILPAKRDTEPKL